MANYNETRCRTFQAGATLLEGTRVIISSGVLAQAGVGATDEPSEIGTVERDCVSGEQVSVRLRSPNTQKMVAAAAITMGVPVYGAASGRVSATSSGTAIGVALEAATAAADKIEVMRY